MKSSNSMIGRRRTGTGSAYRESVLLGALIASALLLSGCSTQEAKLKPGRCNYNSDCTEGFHCIDTYCEDIYFPRRDIKPY